MGKVAPGLSAVSLSLALQAGCTASPTRATPPALPDSYAKCSVQKSQARPLIVEWASSDRAALESLAKRGIVAVRYSGCEMELLSQCRSPQRYSYTPVTLQSDRITISDADELYARVPIGAAKLEGELERSGQLNVDTSIVGTWDAPGGVAQDELAGDCAEATHVLTSLTVGSFRFYSGAAAVTGGGAEAFGLGAGAKSRSEQTLLSHSGDQQACKAATGTDERPPEGCGALLRVEATAILPPRGITPAPPSGSLAPAPEEPPAPAASSDLGAPGQAQGAAPSAEASAPVAVPRGNKLSHGPGFVLGLRGPFGFHFGKVEDGVPLSDFAVVTAGATLEAGARLGKVVSLVATGSIFSGKSTTTSDICPSGVECRASIFGAGADVVLNPLGNAFWVGLGGEYGYLVLKREGEAADTGTNFETARYYHTVGPRLSIGADVMDSYVPQIQYGFMITYWLRQGLSASGTNLVDGQATQFGADGDGVSHTIMAVGRFHFDFGVRPL